MKTTWKDDIFEGNRKYQMITNDDGTVSFVDVTEYTQEGDSFGAAELNSIATELNDKSAGTLKTPRNIKVNLESEAAASFDGSADATPGVSGVLPVKNGGTGVSTLASDEVVIGNGTGALKTRKITNNTSATASFSGTNLITANTLAHALNRTTGMVAADANYTTYMARAVALFTSVPSSMANGTVAFVYE